MSATFSSYGLKQEAVQCDQRVSSRKFKFGFSYCNSRKLELGILVCIFLYYSHPTS
ncbi:conserved hypothetical protein [Ricinus communis]|uniref:Uncharacterized protein n=1 Tax=Ricinus communis TaxID=3988 RepID=B9S1J7_RICCO|nr:conserved hypothetical protein [Ricinus communis]